MALIESEKQFRHFFERLTIGAAAFESVEDGEDFVFVDMNPAGQQLSGVSIAEIFEESVSRVFPGVRDLAEQIALLYPGIRLLTMPGYAADVIARQGMLSDGVEFIQKHFSMADLTEKVWEILDPAPDKIHLS